VAVRYPGVLPRLAAWLPFARTAAHLVNRMEREDRLPTPRVPEGGRQKGGCLSPPRASFFHILPGFLGRLSGGFASVCSSFAYLWFVTEVETSSSVGPLVLVCSGQWE
jgi:hypothetical protein